MRLCIFMVILLKAWHGYADEPKVCLQGLGCVQGVYKPGYQTEEYEAFMGVPFAKPPVEVLRFKNPEPPAPWTDTLMATEPKNHCIQSNYFMPGWPISGDEDCLYLNLYRPVHRKAEKLPVLFYIHGGGFFCGTAHPAAIGPEYIMDSEEVILVVAAYRLGPFGFLSTGDADMPGNFGLKDQNMALRWVHEHIAAFGGDPNAVTIFGHSAGGSSVHYQMLSPLSKGLFQRAIMMSGSALAPFAKDLKDEEKKSQALQVAHAAGLTNASELTTEELHRALRSMDATTILQAGGALKFWHFYKLANFRPTIEQPDWPNAFISTAPKQLMQSAEFGEMVPVLLGLVPIKGEGTVMILNTIEPAELRQQFNNNFDKLLWQILEFPTNGEDDPRYQAKFDAIVKEYMGGVHELNNDTKHGLLEMIGDRFFYKPFFETLQGLTTNSKGSVRGVFEFNFRGPNTYAPMYTRGIPTDYGVVHLDDMPYLFRVPLLFAEDYAKDSVHARLVAKYVGMHVQFAKNGKVQMFEPLGTCELKNSNDNCNILKFVNDGADFKELISNEISARNLRLWQDL